MLLKEIFEGFEDRYEYQLHQQPDVREDVFGIVDKNGKVVRAHLTANAAKALAIRADLVAKFGRLSVRQLA
jgi:hypothetical protein